MVRRPRRPESLPLLMLVPNFVTILGLCAGLTSLRFTLAGNFKAAAALIVFAAVMDGLDGLIARRLNVASPFGAELDSLSDFVCFGVAPALLVHHLALAAGPDLLWSAALVFSVAACLRLARFNVNRNLPGFGRPHFVGVPAPAGALLGLFPAYLQFAGLADVASHPWLVAPWLAGVGLLMISRLRTFAPKGMRISRASARWLLVGAALAVGLALSRFWLAMIALDLLYLGSLVRGLAGRRRPGAASRTREPRP